MSEYIRLDDLTLEEQERYFEQDNPIIVMHLNLWKALTSVWAIPIELRDEQLSDEEDE